MAGIDRSEKMVLTALIALALIGAGVKYCVKANAVPKVFVASGGEAMELEAVSDRLAESKQVDINRAGAKELTRLKGIGPALAKRIVEYRDRSGPFKGAEDLLSVKGIGAKKLEGIKDAVVIE